MEETTVLDDLNLIAKTLTHAEKYGLECEVILRAMQYIKENPECSISEALFVGKASWDI